MTRTRIISFMIGATAPIALLVFSEPAALAKGPLELSEINIQAALDEAYTQFKDLKDGANAGSPK